jgi:hypothetical protein
MNTLHVIEEGTTCCILGTSLYVPVAAALLRQYKRSLQLFLDSLVL